jgi:hypothetical protein
MLNPTARVSRLSDSFVVRLVASLLLVLLAISFLKSIVRQTAVLCRKLIPSFSKIRQPHQPG